MSFAARRRRCWNDGSAPAESSVGVGAPPTMLMSDMYDASDVINTRDGSERRRSARDVGDTAATAKSSMIGEVCGSAGAPPEGPEANW